MGLLTVEDEPCRTNSALWNTQSRIGRAPTVLDPGLKPIGKWDLMWMPSGSYGVRPSDGRGSTSMSDV